MEKTANYQLNQWKKTDRIMMEDFNRDNAKIDAALKAEETARKAAISAEASARAAAVQAARDACPMVPLRSTTTSSAAQQIDLSLSGIDWDAHGEILIYVKLRAASQGTNYATVRVNNSASGYFGSRTTDLLYMPIDPAGTSFVCRVPRTLYAFPTRWEGQNHGSNPPWFYQVTTCYAPSNTYPRASVSTMNFISTSTFGAGCRLTVLGVKA